MGMVGGSIVSDVPRNGERRFGPLVTTGGRLPVPRPRPRPRDRVHGLPARPDHCSPWAPARTRPCGVGLPAPRHRPGSAGVHGRDGRSCSAAPPRTGVRQRRRARAAAVRAGLRAQPGALRPAAACSRRPAAVERLRRHLVGAALRDRHPPARRPLADRPRTGQAIPCATRASSWRWRRRCAIVAPLLWGVGGENVVLDPLWGLGEWVSFPLFPWLAYPLARPLPAGFTARRLPRLD